MSAQIRIIDNKKVSMTGAEWTLFQSICKSYDRSNFKGEDLFKDLFETDGEGIITFLKPPSNRYVSMEVFLFVVCLMNHQHMRNIHKEAASMFGELRSKIQELDAKKSEFARVSDKAK